jgi:hypothetical protein
MLQVFFTNRVKLAAQKPKATDNLGQREYVYSVLKPNGMHTLVSISYIDHFVNHT